VATEGRWLSDAVVRCLVPPTAHLGKHVFNLVPFDSSLYVNYDIGTTHHYTFYSKCDPAVCGGSCLGPLCLCKKGRSGLNCEVAELEGSNNRGHDLNGSGSLVYGSAISRANEFQPYVVALPIKVSP